MTHRIALTGGPCGGKTTALSRIAERLEALGYRVLMVPEAATMLFKGGLSFVNTTPAQVVDLQGVMLDATRSLEQAFEDIAEAGDPDKTVVLCDRGALDAKAFTDPMVWRTILDNRAVSEGSLLSEYDAVIHMVTAAIGAEEHYTLENNSARTETPEQAADVDRRLQDAWTGHPHLRVVDNSTDFEEKVRRVTSHVCQLVGIPEPIEAERRFLVSWNGEVPQGVHVVRARIEQEYLVTRDRSVPRVRSWESRGHRTYTQTTKVRRPDGSSIEKERRLSPREYLELLSQRDKERYPVRKERAYFVWEGQYVELDTFRDCELQILEIEVPDMQSDVVLPPFLTVHKEITDSSDYSNYAIAKWLALPGICVSAEWIEKYHGRPKQ
jgi:CYTH domain-containing protein/thymidylate kinase